MPNRQHGRGRPSGGRNLSGGRSLSNSRSPRAVPVSRAYREAPQPGTPAYIEPEVRRWPHPLEDAALPSAPAPEPALHYIRCALSYQNQLLADVKALLEQLAAAAQTGVPAAEAEKPDGNLSKL